MVFRYEVVLHRILGMYVPFLDRRDKLLAFLHIRTSCCLKLINSGVWLHMLVEGRNLRVNLRESVRLIVRSNLANIRKLYPNALMVRITKGLQADTLVNRQSLVFHKDAGIGILLFSTTFTH